MAGHRKPRVLYLSPDATSAEISYAYSQVFPGDRIVFEGPVKATAPPKPPKTYECPVCFAKMRKAKKRLPILTWWGIREVCEALRVSPKTVYANARSGKWPATKVGRSWRFDVWAIRKMLKGGWAMKL
jgi:excisionase family DNA binding protein